MDKGGPGAENKHALKISLNIYLKSTITALADNKKTNFQNIFKYTGVTTTNT